MPTAFATLLQYFRRLHSAAPEAWVVAEKILQPEESLPDNWAISGTTGYDFLNLAGGLFVDPHGEAPLNELYRRIHRRTRGLRRGRL